MSIELDKRALENIRTYRYYTHGLTWIERVLMDPFWNLTCRMLPQVRPSCHITTSRWRRT